jgi:hypothetical protein
MMFLYAVKVMFYLLLDKLWMVKQVRFHCVGIDLWMHGYSFVRYCGLWTTAVALGVFCRCLMDNVKVFQGITRSSSALSIIC